MRLQETTVRLRLEPLRYFIKRKWADVHPGRGIEQGALGATKNQLPNNLLGPGSSSLGVGGDNIVVVPKLEPIPAG